jgi:hypothetical protein
VSRDDGFPVMDIRSDLVNDPKFKRLARHSPDHVAVAGWAYIATVGASWSTGQRVSIEDAWPGYLPFDQLAVDGLIHVGLLDSRGFVVPKTWRGWFEAAKARREEQRRKWRTAQRLHRESHGGVSDDSSVVTAASGIVVPSVPSVRKEPPNPPRGGGRRAEGTNPRAIADRLNAMSVQADSERKDRSRLRRLAEMDGRLTPVQRAEMDERDAPLDEIPAERGAAYRVAS